MIINGFRKSKEEYRIDVEFSYQSEVERLNGSLEDRVWRVA